MIPEYLIVSTFKRFVQVASKHRFTRMVTRLLKLQFCFLFQHPAICDFPSYFFYDNKLITDNSVKNREVKNLDFWPSPHRGPIAFCHVEGTEEVSVIATADSGAESKYNEKEANKVVSHIFRR